MKKLLGLLVALSILLALTACGNSSTGTPGGTLSSSGDSEYSYEVGSPVDKSWRFATLSIGSAWYFYGTTLADVVSGNDDGLVFDVIPHSGGVGNMLLLQNGDADIGLGLNCVNAWAAAGMLAFEENGAIPGLRGLIGTLDQMYLGIGVRKGSGIEEIRDITEKKLPINLYTRETGSASEYTTRLVLESIGCSYDDIIAWGGSVTHTDFASVAAACQDGKCDFFMQYVPVGHAAFAELCATSGVIIGGLDEQSLAFLRGRGYSVATMPPNSFSGQTEAVACACISTSIVTTEALPDEVAYRIVKQIYENPDDLTLGHPGFAGFDRENCADSALLGGLPIHDGAAKYYQEIGLLKS